MRNPASTTGTVVDVRAQSYLMYEPDRTSKHEVCLREGEGGGLAPALRRSIKTFSRFYIRDPKESGTVAMQPEQEAGTQ
jgi:hypothetical protein